MAFLGGPVGTESTGREPRRYAEAADGWESMGKDAQKLARTRLFPTTALRTRTE